MAAETVSRPDSLGRWIRGWDVIAAFALLVASFLMVRLEAIPELLSAASDKAYFSGLLKKHLLLDTHRNGYSFETVRDHLRALGDDGRAYYGNTFIPIYDLALSLFLLTFCVLFILYATQPEKGHALSLSRGVRKLLLVPPALQFLFDVGENLTLRHLLTEFPRITQKVVETASMMTQLKWLTIYATTLVMIGLAAFTFYRLLMGGRTQGAG